MYHKVLIYLETEITMAWTNEMIDSLKRMWKKGLTTNEIAKELGVSKNSIVGKVHRLNLIARPSPIKKKEKEVAQPQKSHVEKTKNEPQKTAAKNETAKVSADTVETSKTKASCIKLAELDSHTCRWPIGDPKDDNFCFCGKKVRSGQTYCDEHAAIAYVKPNKK